MNESSRSFAYLVLRKLKLLRLAPALEEKPVGIHSHTRLGPLPIIWATECISPRYRAAVEAWGDER